VRNADDVPFWVVLAVLLVVALVSWFGYGVYKTEANCLRWDVDQDRMDCWGSEYYKTCEHPKRCVEFKENK